MRQAFAGMLWSKQYYGYNVARWLDGDPGLPRRRRSARPAGTPAGGTSTPPTSCRCPTRGSTRGSRPGTSRSTRSRSPTSTRPSRSTSSSSCAANGSSTRTARCPPTSGRSTTSTRRSMPRRRYLVWDIDGRRDTDFLKRIFNKLLLNFTWWLNREDAEGNDLFSGGFLGLDNIGASTARTCRPGPSSSNPTRPPGCSCTACRCCGSRPPWPRPTPPTRTSRRPSSSSRADRRRDEPERPVGPGRRLLLRRPQARGWIERPDQGPLDGRPDPAAADCDHPATHRRPRAGPREAVRRFMDALHLSRSSSARAALSPGDRVTRRARSASSRRSVSARLLTEMLDRGRVPVAPRVARAVRSGIATRRSGSSSVA